MTSPPTNKRDDFQTCKRCLVKTTCCVVLLILFAPLTSACQRSLPPVGSPAIPAPDAAPPLAHIEQDTAYLGAVEGVSSVVRGLIEGRTSTATLPPEGDEPGVSYSTWRVRVTRYIVGPLPYDHITLRVVDEVFFPDGARLGSRNPFKPSEGDEVILFLTNKTQEGPPLLPDEFTTSAVAGPFALTHVQIREDRVAIIRDGHESIEPVEDFIDRIQQYARQAGRTVP